MKCDNCNEKKEDVAILCGRDLICMQCNFKYKFMNFGSFYTEMMKLKKYIKDGRPKNETTKLQI